MDFLKIGKNKLKITLTPEELKRYKLDKVGADDDLFPHRRAIFRVIDLAGDSVGFYPGEQRLLIQLYPSKLGAELFVTKLTILTEAQRSVISRADNLTSLHRSRRAYFFETVSDAIALARSVAARGDPHSDSALYITELGSVVLEVDECVGKRSEYPEIFEFSDPLSADFFTYLREHSITLYEKDAIETLASL